MSTDAAPGAAACPEPPYAFEIEWSRDPGERERQLGVLLDAYNGEREYDAQTLSSLTGVFATIIGVLSVVGSAVAFGSLHTQGLPRLILFSLPIIPFPFLGWGAICANAVVVRGEVIALYEIALRDAARLRIGTVEGRGGLPVPFGGTLVGRVWWGRGSVLMLANFIVIGVMYIGILALSSYIADARHSDWAIGAISLPCLIAFAWLLHEYLIAFQPRSFMDVEARKAFGGSRIPFDKDSRSRTPVWNWIGLGGRSWVPYIFLGGLAVVGTVTVIYKREHAPTPPSSRTKAVLFAAELAASLHDTPIVSVRQYDGSRWDVELVNRSGPLAASGRGAARVRYVCFRLDTKRFDVSAPHGFGLIPCAEIVGPAP